MNYNAPSSNIVALCDATSATEVAVREYGRLHNVPHVELHMSPVQVTLSLEDLTVWQKIKLLLSLLANDKYVGTLEYNVLLTRAAAIQANDALIEALYYDDQGNHIQ